MNSIKQLSSNFMYKLDDDKAQIIAENVNQLINIHKLDNYQACFAGATTTEGK